MEIWKFPLTLTERQDIPMPPRRWPLTVQLQGGVPTLWMLVEPQDADKDLKMLVVEMYGTGQRVYKFHTADYYLGTVQKDGYVWHYFASEPVRVTPILKEKT